MKLAQVAVDLGQGYIQMSLPEYFALPLVERIRLILRQQMRFYDEGANPIPLNDGLRLLREQQPG